MLDKCKHNGHKWCFIREPCGYSIPVCIWCGLTNTPLSCKSFGHDWFILSIIGRCLRCGKSKKAGVEECNAETK